jgi:hypothetical protein
LASRSLSRRRFFGLSEENFFTHRTLLSSTRSSGEVADFDRGDDSEKASVVVLDVGRFDNELQTGSSTVMEIFLKKSFFA